MINCIAIDDEPLALVIIEELCKKVPELSLKRSFTKLSSAKMYLNEFPVDLIFLDIKMPHQNGMDFYKSLETSILVVFTTAYPNYAVDGFEVNALDYLLKPIDIARFKEACSRAILHFDKSKERALERNYIHVRSEYALVKVDLKSIIYIETMDDYVKIHLENSKTVITLMSLKNMMDKLPKNMFFRVHRSYIISLAKISSVRSNSIFMSSIEIPIGASHKKGFLMVYNNPIK